MDGMVSFNGVRQPKPGKAEVLQYGDVLVHYLRHLGVGHVFGVPGGAIEPLLNALARGQASGGPQCVVTRHETAAAFMADGYHQASGRLGVCFATTGPGTTNLVTGVASAHANDVPLLIVTAQTAIENFGRGALQESSCTGTNTLALLQPITHYNTLVSHPRQFETKLAAAIMTALGNPGGPAHLSIPADILAAPVSEPPRFFDTGILAPRERLVDLEAVESLYQALAGSRRTVFVVGQGAATAVPAILQLAVARNCPVVTTPQGKGLVSPRFPLYRGVIGFAGHRSALDVLADRAVDLVVVVGSSLGEWASNGWDRQRLLNERLVLVDSAPRHFLSAPMARLHVRGDMNLVFEHLTHKFALGEPARRTARLEVQADPGAGDAPQSYPFTMDGPAQGESCAAGVDPRELMATLSRVFPPQTRYFADSGNSFAWAIHYLHPEYDHQGGSDAGVAPVFNASLTFASMGWAISAAIGTAFGGVHGPVVCITGDGSFLMSSQEITVAAQHRLPVVYVILNDSAYGMVKHGQRMTGGEPLGFALPRINFADMARAMGIPGEVITTIDDLEALDSALLRCCDGPLLLDVRIDGEVKPPIDLRTRLLKEASGG